MKIELIIGVAVVGCIVSAIGACRAGWDDVPASATAPSKDYPCGIVGVPCLDSTGKFNHTCCWQGETCGGGEFSVGCPANECCDVRPFTQDEARYGDAGGSAPFSRHPQVDVP